MEWMTIIEWTAVIFGFICVFLNAMENVWGWPTGLVSVGLYFIVFFNAKLYADFTLQIFFFVTGIYGWYNWLYGGKDKDDLPITTSSVKDWLTYIIIGIASLLVIGYLFDTYTDADLAYWDAYTTAFSLVAQVLMARKKIENWIIWIAVDVIAVGIYFVKGLYPTAILYAGFLVLATMGYLNWRKRMREAEMEDRESYHDVASDGITGN
jgi:nicotinamide mononucleotide transporter